MVVNLSVSDALLLIIFLFTCDDCYDNNCLIALCYTASMLSTLGITIDKYISVQYSLRYNTIVTTRRVRIAAASVWILSTGLAVLISLVEVVAGDSIYFHIPHSIVRFLFCFIFLVCSLHVRNVRNRHEEAIRKQRRYFGVQAEQMDMLQHVRTSVVDIIRLNVTTAVTVFLGTLLMLMWSYGFLKGSSHVFISVKVVYVFYLCSNPVLYIMVTKKLREEYRKVFCSWCRTSEVITRRNSSHNQGSHAAECSAIRTTSV
jgi:hypothetical protein